MKGGRTMTITKRGILKVAAAALMGAVWTASPALAQSNYKAEYKVSTVVGAPFPWGLSRSAGRSSSRSARKAV
jgi:hypothetical protein